MWKKLLKLVAEYGPGVLTLWLTKSDKQEPPK